MEAEESPHAACRREVPEEIGLNRPLGRVLVVDWAPSQPDCPVPADELDGFAFVRPDQVAARVRPIVARRIQACLNALGTGAVAALDDGSPIT